MKDVNVESLLAALNSMKESMSTTEEEAIIKEIEDNQVIQTNAKQVLIEANKKILQKYTEIKEMIEQYIGIANQIKRYQDLEEDIESMERKISREESEEEPDYSYIRSLRREITACRKEMQEIKADIESKL